MVIFNSCFDPRFVDFFSPNPRKPSLSPTIVKAWYLTLICSFHRFSWSGTVFNSSSCMLSSLMNMHCLKCGWMCQGKNAKAANKWPMKSENNWKIQYRKKTWALKTWIKFLKKHFKPHFNISSILTCILFLGNLIEEKKW